MSQKKAKGRGTMSRRVALQEAARRREVRHRRLVRAAQIGIPVIVIGVGVLIVLAVTGKKATNPTAVTDVSTTSLPPTTTTEPIPEVTPTVKSCSDNTDVISGTAIPQFPTPPVQMLDVTATYQATFETTSGTIVASLSPTIAPVSVNNFVFLARCGFFDNTPIERVVPDFVIQMGDPTGTKQGGPGYTIKDELPPSSPYPLGALAMANTGQPHTGGSQFFIITGSQGEALPPSYSLFGQVIQGFEVAKAIEQIPPGPNEAPTTPVTIKKITIQEKT